MHAQPQNRRGPLCTAERPTYNIASISETTKTNQHEISGQYLDNENIYPDEVLWRHNKSKMADGRYCEHRQITHLSEREIFVPHLYLFAGTAWFIGSLELV